MKTLGAIFAVILCILAIFGAAAFIFISICLTESDECREENKKKNNSKEK